MKRPRKGNSPTSGLAPYLVELFLALALVTRFADVMHQVLSR